MTTCNTENSACNEKPSSDTNAAQTEHTIKELGGEAQSLFPIEGHAAREFRDHAESMVHDVNHAILKTPDAAQFMGPCSVNTISDNHHNHARFMGTIFTLGLPRLLARIMPWAYRVYSSRGVKYDYFPAELKAWRTAVKNHLDPSPAESIISVYEWMLNQHQTMMSLSQNMGSLLPQSRELTDTHRTLLHYLLSGDSQKTRETVHALAPTTKNLDDVYVDELQPVMYRVGDLWAESKISISEEHMATAMVNRTVASTYEHFPMSPNDKGKVVVACATDEYHELGPRIVADLLELDGWDVTFLGANVPPDDFHEMVRDIRPSIVALSATVPHHLLTLRDMLKQINNDSDLEDTRTLVGGVAFSLAPEAADCLNIDAMAQDGKQAVTIAREWHKEGS